MSPLDMYSLLSDSKINPIYFVAAVVIVAAAVVVVVVATASEL